MRFSTAIAQAAAEVKGKVLSKAIDLADDLEKVFEMIKLFASTLNDLNSVETIPDMGPFADALREMVVMMTNAIMAAVAQVGEQAIRAAEKLADEVENLIGVIGPAVQALGAMAQMEAVSDLRERGGQLEEAINIFVYYINRVAQFWATTALDEAVAFSENAQKIIAVIGPAAQAVGAIAGMPEVANLRERGASLEAAINIFVYYIQRAAQFWAGVALEAAVSFSENAGKIIALIQPAVQAVTAMLRMPEIEGLREQGARLEAAINILVYHIVKAAEFWAGTALDSVAEFAQATTQIVGMVKPSIDAIGALMTYQSAGPIDVTKAVYSFKNDMKILVGALVNLATMWETEAVSVAAAFASSVSTVVGMIEPSLKAIAALMTYESAGSIDVTKAVYTFKNDMKIVVGALVNLATMWETEAVSAAATFASSISTIVSMIEPAIEAINTMAKYTAAVGLTKAMNAFEADLISVVTKLGEIAEKLSGEGGIGKAQAFATAAEAIRAAIETGLGSLSSLEGGGATSAAGALGEFAKAAEEAMKRAVAAIESGMEDIVAAIRTGVENILETLGELPGQIAEIFSSYDWASIGKGIASGIAAGITAGAGAIKQAAEVAARAAYTEAKAELGIASPSSVMREEVGRQAGLGMALGMEDMIPRIRAAMEQMTAQFSLNGLTPALAGVKEGDLSVQYIDQRMGGGAPDIEEVASRLEWLRRMRR